MNNLLDQIKIHGEEPIGNQIIIHDLPDRQILRIEPTDLPPQPHQKLKDRLLNWLQGLMEYSTKSQDIIPEFDLGSDNLKNYLIDYYIHTRKSELLRLTPNYLAERETEYIIKSYVEEIKSWENEARLVLEGFSKMSLMPKNHKMDFMILKTSDNFRLFLRTNNNDGTSRYRYFIPSSACALYSTIKETSIHHFETNDPLNFYSKLKRSRDGVAHNYHGDKNTVTWLMTAILGGFSTEKDYYEIPSRLIK